MSALPPIATAKADIRNRSCPLYPRKQTYAVQHAMSALGQKRTSRGLFDHLVGAGEYCRRNGEAQRLRGLEVDRELVLGRCLHRKIARLLAFKDAIDIAGRLPVLVDKIRPIGDQPAVGSEEAGGVDC